MPTPPTTAPPPAAKPKAPPPPANSPPSANGRSAAPRKFGVKGGIQAEHQRVVIYGSGGIGKTELASNVKAVGLRPLFLDIGAGTSFLDVDRVDPSPQNWDEARAALQDADLWRDCNVVVVDDLTTAEGMATAWTLANVKAERSGGQAVQVSSIEGYGWGKGSVHVYETFLGILGDLDAHIRAGRQVVCISHDCTAKVPNPSGEDYIRYEPRLQNTANGNIRARVKEWADHLFFIGYDIFAKDRKATGAGTRTIYPVEMPTHLAKSRSLSDPIEYERGSSLLWKQLFSGVNHVGV